MPRTTVVECEGCLPLRALSFDVLGLIKVIEVKRENGVPEVVEKWGLPDAQRCIVATSLSTNPSKSIGVQRLGVARKNRVVEILDPTNGTFCSSFEVNSVESSPSVNVPKPDNDDIVGLHVFGRDRLNKCLACTEKGNVIIRSFEVECVQTNSVSLDSPHGWKVCGSGSVLCCQVDGSEKYAAFGGKGVELNTWDLEKGIQLWTAKAPRRNTFDLFTPTWISSATFLSKEDHRKIVVGTSQHEVRLYDIATQRRPTLSFNFGEHAIKVVEEDLNGYTVYVGTGSGDVASFDMRTGRLLGSFKGKCCGSVRSIVRHPELPLIASCGLDRYLRIWHVQTRKLLAVAFLKQQLTSVLFDSNFTAAKSTISKDVTEANPDKIQCELSNVDTVEINELPAGSKRKSSKGNRKKPKENDEREPKLKKKKAKVNI